MAAQNTWAQMLSHQCKTVDFRGAEGVLQQDRGGQIRRYHTRTSGWKSHVAPENWARISIPFMFRQLSKAKTIPRNALWLWPCKQTTFVAIGRLSNASFCATSPRRPPFTTFLLRIFSLLTPCFSSKFSSVIVIGYVEL